MRYFVAVAQELNFTKASQVLHTAQPSLSQQIKRLEEDIRVKLFYRNKHEVRLTKAGTLLRLRAEEILRQVDEAAILARRAAEEEFQIVTIGLNPSAEVRILPTLLKAASQNASLQLVIESHPTIEQVPLLRSGQLDAAFMRAPDSPCCDITFETILKEKIVVALPANHRLAKRRAISVEALKSMPYVAATGAAISRTVEKFFSQAGLDIRPVRSADNVLANLNMINAGVGFSLIPDYVQGILPKNVVVRPLHSEFAPVVALLVGYRKDNHLPALQSFLEILRSCFPVLPDAH